MGRKYRLFQIAHPNGGSRSRLRYARTEGGPSCHIVFAVAFGSMCFVPYVVRFQHVDRFFLAESHQSIATFSLNELRLNGLSSHV